MENVLVLDLGIQKLSTKILGCLPSQAYSETLSRRNFRRLLRRFKATLGKFGQNVVRRKAI